MNQGAEQTNDTFNVFVIEQDDGRWLFTGRIPRGVSVQKIQVVTVSGPVGFEPQWPIVPITSVELASYQKPFTLSPYNYSKEPYQADRHGTVAGKNVLHRKAEKGPEVASLRVRQKITGAVIVLGVLVVAALIVLIVWSSR